MFFSRFFLKLRIAKALNKAAGWFGEVSPKHVHGLRRFLGSQFWKLLRLLVTSRTSSDFEWFEWSSVFCRDFGGSNQGVLGRSV